MKKCRFVSLMLMMLVVFNFLSYAVNFEEVIKEVRDKLINLPKEYDEAVAQVNELIIKLKEVEKLVDGIKDYDVYYYLGVCYIIVNKDKEALDVLDKEIKLSPLNVDAYYFRAQIYFNKIEEEFEDNKELTEEQLNQKMQLLDKIIADLEKVLKLAPEYIGPIIAGMRTCDTSEVLLDLGVAYKLKGDKNKAKEIFEKIINQYKDGVAYEEAKDKLGELEK